MRSPGLTAVATVLVCCSSPEEGAPAADDAGAPTEAGSGDGGAPDAAPEASGPGCDLSKPFAAPRPVGGVNTPTSENDARLSPDELTIFFARDAFGDFGIYRATRVERTAVFSEPAPMTDLNSANGEERSPSPSADLLTLYFVSTRGGGSGDVFVARRADRAAAFGAATAVPPASTTTEEFHSYVRPDGKVLYYAAALATGNFDLYEASVTASGVGSPKPLTTLNTADAEAYPVISADGLTIFFDRTNSHDGDIWVAHRATVDAVFAAPTPVAELNGASTETPTWLSPDGCSLYFGSDRSGPGSSTDIWVATRPK
jgi:Tol biopolymer transport system component